MALLALLPFLACLAQQLPINSSSIFGVRWFLGEKFRFQEPVTIVGKEVAASHLMLFFNSFSGWPSLQFSVWVGGVAYGCGVEQVEVSITANHHPNFNEFASPLGANSTFFIHKCPLLFADEHFLPNTESFEYSVSASDNSSNILLFAATLRSPSYSGRRLSLTVFGDWGLMSNYSGQSNISEPITECLLREVERDRDIGVMLLLGDLAYDLEGANYVNFFTYLQPFSQRLPILLTPGNHESIKHSDIYQLVKHSFYSPYWAHFYGYFDMVALGDAVFIGYVTESLFPSLARDSHSSLFEVELKQEYGNYETLFALQLSGRTKERLRGRTVIGYSHYPTFCSEEDHHESCENYRRKHLPYTSQLQQAGMALLFSGHLHFYERSKQVCQQAGAVSYRQQRGPAIELAENCTIFILEGAGGNNYYVETSRHFKLKEHSQQFLDNTGFGVLALPFAAAPAHFKHILASQYCPIADSIYLTAPHSPPRSSERALSLAVILLSLLCVSLLAGLLRKRGRQQMLSVPSKSATNVLEMVEPESTH